MPSLSTDKQARKDLPIASGVLRYFPDALAAVAAVSKLGNDQHNPGQPLHWSRGKSDDHEDCLLRHLLEAGTLDSDGALHSAKVAWRALAILQLECEKRAATEAQPKIPKSRWVEIDQAKHEIYAECDRPAMPPPCSS